MVFIKRLVPLSILYCFEGIMLGLILYSVPSNLIDKGVEINRYNFSFVVLIPYVIRYIVAPLFDSVSWDKIGRRRS